MFNMLQKVVINHNSPYKISFWLISGICEKLSLKENSCVFISEVSFSQIIINNTLHKGKPACPTGRQKSFSVRCPWVRGVKRYMLLSFVWKDQKGCPLCIYLIGLSMAGWEFSATHRCLACIRMWRGAGDGPQGKLFIIPQTPLSQ